MKKATAEKSLPLPLQFMAAWIGMWLGEHQARVIEFLRAENAALLEELANTIYHESRHGEQWFHAAQSQAAAAVPAKTIKKRMDIPIDVAEAAAKAPAKRGSPEGEVGNSVYTSVYGERGDHRDNVLTDLNNPKPQPGTYDQYRALPEEEDAWRQGDAVEEDYKLLGKTP